MRGKTLLGFATVGTLVPVLLALWVTLTGSFPFTDWPGSEEPAPVERLIVLPGSPKELELRGAPRGRGAAARAPGSPQPGAGPSPGTVRTLPPGFERSPSLDGYSGAGAGIQAEIEP